MKNILWIQTGGTIACTEKEGQGLSPEGGSEFIKSMLTLIPNDFDITVTPYILFNLDSTNINHVHWQELARVIFNSCHEYDGFVITHGTDTMQYTSCALSLMLKDFSKPVIITGSQKPFVDNNSDTSDASFNFVSAFACACLKKLCGVYICFGGRIISGAGVVKLYSRSVDGFIDVEGDFGKIKLIDNNSYKIVLFKEPPKPTLPILMDKMCEDVFYLKITPCTKPDIIEYIRNSSYRGVVCEAFGLGGIPERLVSGFAELCRCGIRVIAVSQCVYEGVDMGIYNVGLKARDSGIESGGNMTGSMALIKLMHEIGNEY